MKIIKSLYYEEEGASLIEYALVAILIAVALVGSLQGVRTSLVGLYQTIAQSVADTLPNG